MTKKRIAHIIFAALVLLSPAVSYAYDFEVDGIYYNIVNRKKKQVEVTHWEEETTIDGVPHRHHHAPCGCCRHDSCDLKHLEEDLLLDSLAVIREKTAYIGELLIPESVKFKHRKFQVVGVGDGAFYKRDKLTKVVLPESVRYVSKESFDGCKNLQEITLPKHLLRIGMGAFRRCSKLTSLALTDDIQTIDAYAFAFCANLTTIYWPLNVTSMPGNVFWSCTNLQTIQMPHLIPPTITKDGLVMNFKDIVFLVNPEAFPAFLNDPVWQTKQLRELK